MYIEESYRTPVNTDFDVAVCGGGIAGVSGALACARNHKKTILFEKSFMIGGLATAGLVTIFLPICDGMGRQVSFSLAEELIRLSVKMGYEDKFPYNWLENKGTKTKSDPRFEVQYNPQLFAILLEQLLIESGVTIMYGTYVENTIVEKNKITHVVTMNKSGRTAYKVSNVVDATGDCDVMHISGIKTDTFKQGNVLAGWFYSLGEKQGYRLNTLGFADVPEGEKTGKEEKPLSSRRFSGLQAKEISEYTIMSHSASLEYIKEKRLSDKTFVPVTIPTYPQIRMTRKIQGEYSLSYKEEHKYFEDSIGMVSNWKKRGPVYEIPFRTLYSSQIVNLIAAGRCVSCDEEMWDILRVIPCCCVTGEAAGLACSLCDDFSSLDVSMLQKKLIENGVLLHEKDLKQI